MHPVLIAAQLVNERIRCREYVSRRVDVRCRPLENANEPIDRLERSLSSP